MADDAPVGMLVVGLACDVVALLSADNGEQVGEGQLVTVAVAKTVIVLRDNGEHVEWVKVIVLM